MAAPVSHHHSVTCFSIVGIPAIVDIFHPRSGCNSFIVCFGNRYTWITHACTISTCTVYVELYHSLVPRPLFPFFVVTEKPPQ